MMHFAGIPIVEKCEGVVVALTLFTVVAFVAVVLRLTTRLILIKSFGVDEFFIALAGIGTVGYFVSTIIQVKYGLGLPAQPATLQNFLKSLLSTIVFYSFTHLTCKFSILFQCKRIFISAVAQRLFLGMIIWLTGYGLFCFFSSLVTCVPIAKYWNDSIPGGCINRMTLHFVLAGFNIVNDVALLLAPIPFLRSLQIPKKAKIILMAVFACGGFACVVAIIRLYSLVVFNTAPIEAGPIKGVEIALWSGLEINTGIICACVPALKPLFVKFFPRMLSGLGDSNRRSKQERSFHGSVRLRSRDDKQSRIEEDMMRGSHYLKSGINVRQSIEMKTMGTSEASDDDVAGGQSGWSVECKAHPQVVDRNGQHAV